MDVSSISPSPANRAWSAPPLALSSKDHPARQDRRDRLDPQGHRVRWVPKVHRVSPVSPDLRALLGSLGRAAPLVTLDQLASVAHKDSRAMSDQPVPLALTELLALRDLRARRVVLDHRGRRVIPELLESTAAPDRRDSPGRKDRKVTLEIRDLRAYPEARDRRDRRATPDSRDPRETPAAKGPQAPTGPQSTRSLRTTQPPLDWLQIHLYASRSQRIEPSPRQSRPPA